MPIFELTQNSLSPVPRASLSQQSIRERDDLQRLLKASISVLADDLLVIGEEFCEWSDSRRRIDLLAIDRTGAIVVIELKRTENDPHMELQAIRYAAMVSTLKFEKAVSTHAAYLKCEPEEAEESIRSFLKDLDSVEVFGHRVRILLVAPEFSKELTTSVLWLNSIGLHIRCVRIRPYILDGRTLLEIDQVIPLREAQEYIVQVREKQEEVREASEFNIDFTRYDLTVGSQVFPNVWKRNLIWRVIASAAAAGLSLETLSSILTPRKLIVVEGHLRGEAFLKAAERAKTQSGHVLRSKRWFLSDEHLIDIGGQTVAISNQWGKESLPLVDQIMRAVPGAKMSYKEASAE